jgi:hypothetical protein
VLRRLSGPKRKAVIGGYYEGNQTKEGAIDGTCSMQKDMGNFYKIWASKEKMLLLRHRCRWENNIKIVFKINRM